MADTLLPTPAPMQRLPHQPAGWRAAGQAALPGFRDLRVLLVEDNDINQQIASELLQAAGVGVDIAGSGRVALERLAAVAADHYGAVFMDLQMPGLDGLETTRLIRADGRYADLPIVAMSALSQERSQCLASGMDDHIAKPIDPAALLNTLARWCPLNLSQSIQPPAAPDAAATQLHIEGIDVLDGLSRTLGNLGLYLQLLGRFRAGQSHAVPDIRAAMQADDFSRAAQIAHTLKGVAGQLGAQQVHALAAALEQQLQDGAAVALWQPLLDQLDTAMQDLDRALQSALTASTGSAPASASTILIVDDVPAQISLLSQLLKATYKLKIATNGAKAVEIAAGGTPPDLILLDLVMPEMDGYETCRRLKENPRTAAIPVVFLSARCEPQETERALKLGAADFLCKSISAPDLMTRVAGWLGTGATMPTSGPKAANEST